MGATKDFSARQIRSSQLIASGGIPGTRAGLIVYSASNATNLRGSFDEKMLDDVGNDVYFFVSGSKNSKVARGDSGNGYAGVTLFGGDVVFSGTLYADRMVIEVDLSTTGSVLISGSLFVSRSVTIHQGLSVNQAYGSLPEDDVNFYGTQRGNTGFHWNTDGADNGELFLGNDAVAVGFKAFGATSETYMQWNGSNDSFIVSSPTVPGMIVSDGSTNQLILHSSGSEAQNTAGAMVGSDVATYISGAVGSAGVFKSFGATLFTGDVVVSGSADFLGGGTATFDDLYVNNHAGISGSMTVGVAGTGGDVIFHGDTAAAYFHWDADSAENGSLTLGANDTGVDFLVFGETSGKYVNWDQSTDTLFVYGLLNQELGNFTFNDAGGNYDFRVESDQIPGMIISDGGTNQLILHSSGTDATTAKSVVGSDVGIYLSGAVGSLDVANSKGTTLVTGDMLISGTLRMQQAQVIQFANSGFTVGSNNGSSMQVAAQGELSLTAESSGMTADFGTQGFAFKYAGANFLKLTKDEGVLRSNDTMSFVSILSGTSNGAKSPNESAAGDTSFFVSGSVMSRGSENRGTSLFGGDLVVSGGLHGGYSADMDGDILTLASNVIAGSGVFFYNGMADWRKGGLAGPDGEDVVFSISGSIGGKDYIDEEFGDGITCIGGDLVVSGNTYLAMKQTGPSGLAGSDLANVGVDVNFFVSGSDGGKVRGEGVAVFGGDLQVSGGIYIGSPASGDLASLLMSDGNGLLTIDGENYIQLNADSYIKNWVGGKNLLTLYGNSGVVFNDDKIESSDFRVETKEKPHAFFIDASTEQVIILSGSGGPTDPMESGYTDLAFFVSGSIGSAVNGFGAEQVGNGYLGVAVFGGDVVISGALFTPASTIYVGGAKLGATPTGELLFLSGGGGTSPDPANYLDTNFYVSGAINSMDSGLAGTAVFGGDLVVSGNTRIPQDQRLELGNTGFYLRNNNGDSAEFTMGGQLNISAGGALFLEADSNNGIQFKEPDGEDPGDFLKFTKEGGIESLESALQFHSADGYITMLSGTNDAPMSPNESRFRDINFFVSGSAGSRQGTKRGTALFGGDVVVSGSFLPGKDNTSNLGSEDNRWANVYTGDLHLRNEKGSWTIQEDVDRLIVINNITGKRYKMALEPLGDEE